MKLENSLTPIIEQPNKPTSTVQYLTSMTRNRALVECESSIVYVRLANALQGASIKLNATHCEGKCQCRQLHGWYERSKQVGTAD